MLPRRIWLVLLLTAGLTSSLAAQPKPGYSPSSTHIFPAGGRIGTIVKVRVGTECSPPGTDFELFGRGLSASAKLGRRLPDLGQPSPRRNPTETPITYPREWEATITIAADAARGAAWWRLSCAQGGTGSRPFLVGDLPEFIESEPNSTPAKAEAVTLPVVINGQVYGERDDDYYRFELSTGDVLVCDVLAGRIGSRLDPVVELFDETGQRLNAQQVQVGSDPVLALKAPRDGEYLLRVANITFHGNAACVYRITLSTRPYAAFAFPAGGQAGAKAAVELFEMTGEGSLAARPQRFDLPAAPGLFRPPGGSRPLLRIDERPNLVESEPNNDRPQDVPVPATIHGRLANASDIDRFAFAATKGTRYTIRCRAFPPGLPTLPVLTLETASGGRLSESRAVGQPDREARIEWQAPEDATVRLGVRDLRFGSRGAADFLYRLTIEQAHPDFELAAAADSLNLMQATDSSINIRVTRLGGFEAPIRLVVEGLPEGVSLETAEVPKGKSSLSMKFKATAEAAARSYPLSIVGVATIDGREVRRTLLARHLGIDSEGTSAGPSALDRFHLTVCHKPVFRLYCYEAYQYAHRGTVFPYPMQIERLDGFDQPVTVQIGDRQNRDLDGIEMIPFVISPGRDQGILPIYLPETMHINIQSQSQLYSQAFASFTDKHGRKQSVLVLSEKRNMLRTRPPVVKMFAAERAVSANPGGSFTCHLSLERTTNFPGPMTVLLHGSGKASGFTATPVRFAAGATSAEITVRVPAGETARRPTVLCFRATGQMPNGITAISESKVRFVPAVGSE